MRGRHEAQRIMALREMPRAPFVAAPRAPGYGGAAPRERAAARSARAPLLRRAVSAQRNSAKRASRCLRHVARHMRARHAMQQRSKPALHDDNEVRCFIIMRAAIILLPALLNIILLPAPSRQRQRHKNRQRTQHSSIRIRRHASAPCHARASWRGDMPALCALPRRGARARSAAPRRARSARARHTRARCARARYKKRQQRGGSAQPELL